MTAAEWAIVISSVWMGLGCATVGALAAVKRRTFLRYWSGRGPGVSFAYSEGQGHATGLPLPTGSGAQT